MVALFFSEDLVSEIFRLLNPSLVLFISEVTPRRKRRNRLLVRGVSVLLRHRLAGASAANRLGCYSRILLQHTGQRVHILKVEIGDGTKPICL